MQFQPVTPPFPVGLPQLVVGAGVQGSSVMFTGVFGSGNIMLIPVTKTIIVPDGVSKMRSRGWSGGDLAGGGFFIKVCDVQPGQSIVCTVGAAAGSTSFGSFCSATGASGSTPGAGSSGDFNGTGSVNGAAANIFGTGSGDGGAANKFGHPGLVGVAQILFPNGSVGIPGFPAAPGILNVDMLGCGPGGSGGWLNGGIGADGGDGVNGGGGGAGTSGSGSPNGGRGGLPGGGGGPAGVGGVQGVGARGLIILEW